MEYGHVPANATAEERHEEVLQLLDLILNTAAINASPKLFSAICHLDKAVCEELGLDPSIHAMSDSVSAGG
jgi:hypothetical protein